MPIQDGPQQLTPREQYLMEAETEERRLSREYGLQIKRLEIELEKAKNEGELALKTLESRWASWLTIPKTIIKLPVLVLLGFGYIISNITNTKTESDFWKLIKQ